MPGVALGHHASRLEDGVGDLAHGKLLVVSLLSRDDRGVRGKHEVNTRVRDKVGLELGDIDVKGSIEPEGSSKGGDNLGDEPVKVSVGRPLNVKVPAADVVEGLVVHAEGAVGVLEEGVGGEHTVVGLNDGGGHLGGGGDGEGELGLAAIVDGEPLEEEGSEAGAGSAAGGVEHEEALEAGAVVRELADAVEDDVNDLLFVASEQSGRC